MQRAERPAGSRRRRQGRREIGLAVRGATAALATLTLLSATTAAQASPPSRIGTLGRLGRRVPFDPSGADSAFATLHGGRGYEAALFAARRRANALPQAMSSRSSKTAWAPIGPSPIGSGGTSGGANSGRVTGIALAPGTVYLASAGGGVWSSTDNGTSWSTRTGTQPDIAMGAIAVDPSAPSDLFAGTGEDNECGDCFYGDGILESTDSGSTWALSNPGGMFTGLNMSTIVVEPGASSLSTTTVLAATSSNLFVSTDGGQAWSAEAGTGWTSGNVTSVVVDPLTAPATIYAAVQGIGAETSSGGGSTWTTLTDPSGGAVAADNSNIALAISPGDTAASTTVYASLGTARHGYQGLYVSSNGGSTWSQLTSVPYFTSIDYAYQGNNDDAGGDTSWYNNVLAVDPKNPSIIVAGGITAVESTNGGATWTNLNGGGFFVAPTSAFHPDFHALVFDTAGNLYMGNDGGIWELPAAAVADPASITASSFANLNTNLDITQFYGGISESGNAATVLAGAQDNGTDLYSSSASPPTSWNEVLSGDGGFTGIDPAKTALQYAEADVSIGGNFVCSADGWQTSAGCTKPPFKSANWAAPFIVVPGTPGPTVLFGGGRVYASTDGGVSWLTPDASAYSASDVSALAVAPSNPSVVYAGFDDGTLQLSTDGGTSWTTIHAATQAGLWITSIAVDPADPHTIYLTAAGVGSATDPVQPQAPQVYVFASVNSAPALTAVAGNLPAGMAANSVVPNGSGGLIVATDAGVFEAASLNGSSTSWSSLGTGLPNVQVLDLILTRGGTLIAATHGRGVWTLPLPATPPQVPTVTGVSPSSGSSAGGTAVTITGTNFLTGATVAFGPNPAAGVTVDSTTQITATSPAGTGTVHTVHVTVTTSAGSSATTAADEFTYAPIGYHALTPDRICDTRPSQAANQCTGKALTAGATDVVTVAGKDAVPATGAAAVVLNVTAADPTRRSYFTVFPDGQSRPLASNLNFAAGRNVPNLVTVALGPDGKIDVYNGLGTVDLIVDVEGYFGPEPAAGTGLYDALTPKRICDSRASQPTNQCTSKAPPAGGTLNVAVDGHGGVPASGVAAVVLNVTAIGSPSPGYLTMYPAGTSQPTASNVNYQAGEVVPNRVIVPVGAGGAITIFAGNGSPDIAVDVSGWFTDASTISATGAQFIAEASPVRICDTRSSQPSNQCTSKTLGPASTLDVAATGANSVPTDATAVVLNVTAANETSNGYLTVFPTGMAMPVASDLNFLPGGAVANMTVATLGSGKFSVFNSAGSTDLVVDLVGWFS